MGQEIEIVLEAYEILFSDSPFRCNGVTNYIDFSEINKEAYEFLKAAGKVKYIRIRHWADY